jgi:hypothetical protein
MLEYDLHNLIIVQNSKTENLFLMADAIEVRGRRRRIFTASNETYKHA